MHYPPEWDSHKERNEMVVKAANHDLKASYNKFESQACSCIRKTGMEDNSPASTPSIPPSDACSNKVWSFL